MSRNVFGWDLPPGVSQRMIDEAAGSEAPCDVCGKFSDACLCPECPVCGEYGNPSCYEPGAPEGPPHHGLVRTPEQEASFGEACKRWEEEAERWDRYAAEYNEETDR